MNLLEKFLQHKVLQDDYFTDNSNREKPNQSLTRLLFHKDLDRNRSIGHFCEHDGISICFTRARSSWHAIVPCALKPWWLFLNPQRSETQQQKTIEKLEQDNKQIKIIEVTENA